MDGFVTDTHIRLLDTAVATLPLDNLVTLTMQRTHDSTSSPGFLMRHGGPCSSACDWRPGQRVDSVEMFLLQDHGQRESPLLPSLIRLDLIDDTALSARRTLRLCDALMKRVEQGVPLEVLDLRTCLATSYAVQLLGEIVVEILGPEEAPTRRVQRSSTWVPEDRGHFVYDDNSEEESNDDDDEVVEMEED